jgi:hypothetical protein
MMVFFFLVANLGQLFSNMDTNENIFQKVKAELGNCGKDNRREKIIVK